MLFMLFMRIKKYLRGRKSLVWRSVLFVVFRLFVLFVCMNLLVKKIIIIKGFKIALIPLFIILL